MRSRHLGLVEGFMRFYLSIPFALKMISQMVSLLDLLHRYALCQISRFVYVTVKRDCNVVG